MRTSAVALACLSILLIAQDTAAKPSTPIENCVQKETVPCKSGPLRRLHSCLELCLRYRIAPCLPLRFMTIADGSIQTCDQFAEKWGTTFEELRRLNPGLHENCDNLDVDNDICVLGPDENSEAITSKPSAPTVSNPAEPHTAHTEDSPTSAAAAPSNIPAVVTPARHPKSGAAPVAPSPAPAAQEIKIPEATPRRPYLYPIASGRPLYRNMPRSMPPRPEPIRF